MAKLIDVSLEIHPGMVVWPGDPGVELERTAKLEEGAHSNLSRLACGVHTGTHVDSPWHFLADGKPVDTLAIDTLIGPAWVSDFRGVKRIASADLEKAGIPAGTVRLLMKTDNEAFVASDGEFHTDYAGLDPSGAEWIVRRGIRLVGNDYLSIAVRDSTGPVHQTLLRAEVIIIEGLHLQEAPAGACRLYCLPLLLKGAEGAPARVVLEYE